jgi:hypothetical protein
MFPQPRLTVFLLVVLLALAASSIAQEAKLPEYFVMPLRADQVVDDPATSVTIIRGSIDWPDGRTTTHEQITCDQRGLRQRGGCITFTWEVEPSFCSFLARSVQRRS